MQVRRLKEDELYHHGVKGQRWGIRRYQNPDGSLTEAGRRRYLNPDGSYNARYQKEIGSRQIQVIDGQKTYLSDKQVRNRRNGLAAASIITAVAGLSIVGAAKQFGKFDRQAKSIVDTYHNHKMRNLISPNQLRAMGIKTSNLADTVYKNTIEKDRTDRKKEAKIISNALSGAATAGVSVGAGLAAAKAHSYYRAEQRRKYSRERKAKQQNNQVKQ